jgi:putative ABC transport system permease protein
MSAVSGGVAARRAITRWSMRMFRREWRQQVLVLALLTVAVAATVFGATAAYNATPSRDAEFGRADFRVDVDAGDPSALASAVARVRALFPTTEVVREGRVPIPGTVDSMTVRSQDPHGALSAPMMALRAGRYPTGVDDVAVTDRAAAEFDVALGTTFTAGNRRRHVVGVVENPQDLGDEFILVAPEHAEPRASVVVLARGTEAEARSVFGGGGANIQLQTGAAIQVLSRGTTEKGTAVAIVLGLSTVALLLVALVAAAGFVVVAQRRIRQLGMVAAVGATARQLRFVVVVNGVIVGAAAAVLGVCLGMGTWLATAGAFEAPAGHRIDRWAIPLAVIAIGAVLSVVAATAAAWWPARIVSRVPVVEALSGRPPSAKPSRRSAMTALALAVAGFAAVAAGVDTKAGDVQVPVFLAGLVAVTASVIIVSPTAVRALAVLAKRLPVAARLALRDLGRHQARSGAALAAISLGLGIAVAIVVIATASTNQRSAGNLAQSQLLLRIDDGAGDGGGQIPVRSDAQLADLQQHAAAIAGAIRATTVIRLDAVVEAGRLGSVAFDKRGAAAVAVGAAPPGDSMWAPVDVVRRLPGSERESYRYVSHLFLATDELAAYYGVAGQLDGAVDVYTARTPPLYVLTATTRPSRARVYALATPLYSSAPTAITSAAAVARRGWTVAPSGWLLDAHHPLGASDRAVARRLAATAGLAVETRDQQLGLLRLRAAATAAGFVLALAVLAMTVGLIRGEAANDIRTLTAVGATGSVRRALTAATASALAVAGVVLAVGGAYVVLGAAYLDDLSALGRVPLIHLGVLLAGLPLAAAGSGWLLAGRAPDSVLTRAAIE